MASELDLRDDAKFRIQADMLVHGLIFCRDEEEHGLVGRHFHGTPEEVAEEFLLLLCFLIEEIREFRDHFVKGIIMLEIEEIPIDIRDIHARKFCILASSDDGMSVDIGCIEISMRHSLGPLDQERAHT